jgi:hypothetical protein
MIRFPPRMVQFRQSSSSGRDGAAGRTAHMVAPLAPAIPPPVIPPPVIPQQVSAARRVKLRRRGFLPWDSPTRGFVKAKSLAGGLDAPDHPREQN